MGGLMIKELLVWLKQKSPKKIFIVTGKKSYTQSGAAQFLDPVLNNYPHERFCNFEENPKIEDVYKGIDSFKKHNCDCFIAVGGGSVIDMAKLICFYSREEKQNSHANNFSTQKKLPLVAIPTTAGSGSEATHFAVMYKNKIKYSIAEASILPDLVILNPKLSYTLSPAMKAITGLDALAHAIESYWSNNANENSRLYSKEAILLIWDNLKSSVKNNCFESHCKIVRGAYLAGKAINIAKTTAAHALSYYFSINHNIKHGHAVALTIGNVYDYNYNKSLGVKDNRNKIFSELNSLLRIENNPRKVINQFIFELGVELDFKKLKIDIQKELPKIIKDVNSERLKNNPFQIQKEDFNKLFNRK